MNQKKNYYISAFILYLNYFIHGIGCSVLGQVAVKETLVSQWGISDIGKVTMVAAALGLGRLIALPFAGPLSDKLGRRIASLIGILSYIIFFFGLAISPNMTVAYIAAILGGIANSFLSWNSCDFYSITCDENRNKRKNIFDPRHQKCKFLFQEFCFDLDWIYRNSDIPVMA